MNFIIENVIAKNGSLMLVATSGNIVRVELEGDCCSTSYFDDYSKIDALGLMGERLMSIEDVSRDTPEPDPVPHLDEAQEYHALIIKTDKQSITVDWRNESNGYYGGMARLFLDDEEISSDSPWKLADRLT
jgi:hypothetical protein